jgi:phosphoserine aminotransferase
MFDWHGSGLSVMEMSHRGTYFKEIIETTKKDLRTLMEIPDEFEIFFFQGGASQLFAGIPLNLIGDDTNAGATYLTTGLWSEGAYDEGCKYGKMTEAHNTKKHN